MGGVISCYDSFMYVDRKQIVIDKIKHILQNSKNEPLDCLGSYIVGATLARDDWEDVFQDNYPLIYEIAELGAELETTEDTEYATNIIHEIKEKLDQINWHNKIMKQNEQAILARDMIQMIRENADNSDVLEYLDSFAFSLARGLEDSSVVSWDDLASVCDQRYYSLNNNNPVPLNVELLNQCERSIQKFLPKVHDS